GEGYGHQISTDLACIAMAKRLCGTSDWRRAPRVPGPVADLWCGAPAASSRFVCGVLQSNAHALGVGQGCAPGTRGPAVRCHCRHPNLVRAAPPIRPDMIFGKDRGAPRIHGELLKLGFEVSQSSVANGMDRPCSRRQRHAESVGGFEEHEEDTPCPAKQTLQSHAPLGSIPVRTRCI